MASQKNESENIKMSDLEYEEKLQSLRRYIPFLLNMMTELKVKGNREAQLNKIQSLHDMITDSKKKLKMETLIRCEEVLTNIYFKVNPQLRVKSTSPTANSSDRFLSDLDSSTLTPASPSPPRDIVIMQPVTIPTEKIVDTPKLGVSLHPQDKSHLPKIEVYSNVVINNPAQTSKPLHVTKVPDMSKPPISLDDLKTLEEDVHQKISDTTFMNASVDALQEYRKQLELQIRVDKVSSAMSPKKSEASLSSRFSLMPRTSKVGKPGDSFGSTLSSIDEKLLIDKKKAKKSDRRSSMHKEDTKSKKEAEAEDTRLSSDKDRSKEKKKQEAAEENKPQAESCKAKAEGDDLPKVVDDKSTDAPAKKLLEPLPSPTKDVPNAAPFYKRLADKYHPKPRQKPIELDAADVDKDVSEIIEKNMKISPAKPLASPLSDPKIPLLGDKFSHPPSSSHLPDILQKIFSQSLITNVPKKTEVTAPMTHAPLKPPPEPPRLSPQHLSFASSPDISPVRNMPNLLSPNNQRAPVFSEMAPMPPAPDPLFRQQRGFNAMMDMAYGTPRVDFDASLTPRPDFGSPLIDFEQPRLDFEQPRLEFEPPAHLIENRFNQRFLQFQPDVPMYGNAATFFPPPVEAPMYVPDPTTFYQERAWNENPRWNRDRRPGDPRNYKEYKEMKEREARFAQEKQKEIKDPRLAPREERDAVAPNRDPRLAKERVVKEPPTSRDPRLFRFREKSAEHIWDRDPRQRARSQERADLKKNKYDSKFDRMYAKTNSPSSRSGSTSRLDNTEDSAFVSPLDSLYNAGESKTGRGYGVQKFKIPKKPRDDGGRRGTDNVKQDSVIVINDEGSSDDGGNSEAENNSDIEFVENVVEEQPPAEEAGSIDEVKPDMTKVVVYIRPEDVVDVMRSNDLENTNAPADIDQFVSEYQLEYDESAAQEEIDQTLPEAPKETEPKKSSEGDGPTEQNILAHFFENLLKSKNKKDKKTALFSLIQTFSDSFDDREIQKIRKIINVHNEDVSEDEEAAKDNPPKEPEEKKPEPEPCPENSPEVGSTTEDFPKMVKPRRIMRLSSSSADEDQAEKPLDLKDAEISSTQEISAPLELEQTVEKLKPDKPESPEPVLMSVGERTKNRKRNQLKPKKKLTELDMLHADIQDMFIRDGVLTATGKRMCRILKDDPNALSSDKPPPQAKKVRKKPGPKPKPKVINEDLQGSIKDFRVVINKIPDEMMSAAGTTRKLRNRARSTSYAETEDDVDNDGAVSDFDKSDSEKEFSSESESHHDDNVSRIKSVRKRRGKQWAAGIIPRSKKRKTKESSPEPDADKLVEPDKNYYLDYATKSKLQCKLCDFSGFLLTGHYLREHPDAEVLCSRLSPDMASEAASDFAANGKKYEGIVNKKISAKYNYCCRLCGFSTLTHPLGFYEHVTTHTGEYRHRCDICSFVCATGKTLLAHFASTHSGEQKKATRKTYSLAVVFAYLCGECNFLQLAEEKVVRHANVFHSLDRPPTIFKINMSAVLDPLLENTEELKPSVEDDKCDDVSEDVKMKLRKRADGDDNSDEPPVRKKPGPKSKTLPALKYAKETDEAPKKKPGPKSKTLKLLSDNEEGLKETPARKRKRSVDKLISEDSGDDLDTIITLSSRTSRAAKEKATAKLKSMMENNEAASVRKKTDSESSKRDVDDCVTNQEKKDDLGEEKQECKAKAEEEPYLNVFTCKTDIFQEDTKRIEAERLRKMDELNKSIGSRHTKLDFVDILQSRLNNEDAGEEAAIKIKEEPEESSFSPEKLPPSKKLLDAVATINKKPVLEDDAPLPQSALFFSQNKTNALFSDMIEKLQDKVNEAAVQQEETDEPQPSTSASTSDASTELFISIGNFISMTKKGSDILFSCHVNGCYVVTKDKMVFQLHCKFGHNDINVKTSLCDKCGIVIEVTQDTNLLENLYDHLMFAHSDFLEKKSGSLLRMRRLSGDKLSVKKEKNVSSQDFEECVDKIGEEQEAAVELPEDNPFSFKIVDVMSLAETDPELPVAESPLTSTIPPPEASGLKPVPPLTLISAKQQSPIQLVVKEAKLSASELLRERKAPKALQKFIDTPWELYKCPHFYCMFSTNVRTFLARHLKAHQSDGEVMIPCVYCDIKTPWEHVPVHIDIRHAHCRFACSFCLYRACLKEYVCLHQDQKHQGKEFEVLHLPQHRAAKRFSIADWKTDYKSYCEPFRCACKGKGDGPAVKKYLFENEFQQHLLQVHKTNFIYCGYPDCDHRVNATMMVSHWAMYHGISTYQCGYCKTSGKEISKMYNHFANYHPSMQPKVLVRVLAKLPKHRELGYSKEAFDKLGSIKKMPSLSMVMGKKGSRPIKVLKACASSGATEESTSVPLEQLPAPQPVPVLLKPVPNLKTPQSASANIFVSTPNVQLIVATTSGTSDKLFLLPTTSLSAPKGKLVTSVAPIGKAVTQTSTASKSILDKARGFPDDSTVVNLPDPVVETASAAGDCSNDARMSSVGSEFDVVADSNLRFDESRHTDLLNLAIKSILTDSDLEAGPETSPQSDAFMMPMPVGGTTTPEAFLPALIPIIEKSSCGETSTSRSPPTLSLEEEINDAAAHLPVEHVELSGQLPDSVLSEEVDPLNMDDSNLETPLFEGINIGLDSPPEDPLTITPTLNASIAPDNPLEFRENLEARSSSGPLKITNMRRSSSMVSNSDDESDGSSSEKGKKQGLMGYQLYRCAICNLSFSNVNGFKRHVLNSSTCKRQGSKPYQCVHCDKSLKSAGAIVDHIQSHGLSRFTCSLCNEKFTTLGIVKQHIKTRHSIHQTALVPLNCDRSNIETDEFVVKPCLSNLPNKDKDMVGDSPHASADHYVYTPDQIDAIPIRQIFNTHIKCGLCSYQTKVRVNIVRHLQMHLEEKSVPDIAPVNPVPCLEKNEKMFDKMINLAASSITGRMGANKSSDKEEENFPDFVPTHCRFVCCAQGCSYLCPEEGNLKHHLMALHSDETDFTCAHCKVKITPTDAENVIKHFKLHGLHLYKCHYCSFVHHLKHKVEKHINDGHLDVGVKVVTLRYMEAEPQDVRDVEETQTVPQVSVSNKSKPWRCCMCKSRCATKEDIQAHIINKHHIAVQYKCTLCTFNNDQEESFKHHFDVKHPGQDIDIIFVYQKVEEEPSKEEAPTPFDTTPLWQRDKPRVRHIRGILFDESTPQSYKSPKKTLKASPVTKLVTVPVGSSATSSSSMNSKNLEDCIDAVAKGTADILQSKMSVLEVPEMEDGASRKKELIDDVEEVKQETSVIVIDSDESDLEHAFSRLATPQPSTSKDKIVKRKPVIRTKGVKRKITSLASFEDAPKSSRVEDDEEEKDMVVKCSREHLTSLYGGLGSPHNKQWKCPKCHQFKSKRVSDFMFHIFKDFNVFRFKCKVCADLSITYKYMLDHLKLHAGSGEEIIEPLPTNVKLETWIHMVIREQSLAILKNTLPFPRAPLPPHSYIKCLFCNDRFASMAESCEHMLHHWSVMPYQCQYCPGKYYTVFDLKHHYRIEHPDLKVYLEPKGPTLDQAVQHTENVKSKPLMQRVKWRTKPKEDVIKIDSDDEDKVPDAVYTCNICPWMAESTALMACHLLEQHSVKASKYRAVDKGRDEELACNMCHEILPELRLRHHFMDAHPNAYYCPYRYQCGLCPCKYLTFPKLRMHYNRLHQGLPLSYKCLVEENKTPKKQLAEQLYRCTLCSYRNVSASPRAIRAHVRGHLPPILCNLCKARFQYRNHAHSHHAKEHAGLQEDLIALEDVLTEFHRTMYQICGRSVPVNAKSNVAKKSTSAPSTSVPSTSALSTSVPRATDYSGIVATFTLEELEYTTTVEQMRKLVNLETYVDVSDCVVDWCHEEEAEDYEGQC